MKTKRTLLLALAWLSAHGAHAATAVWQASSGLLPNQISPPYTLIDTATPEEPVLSSALTLSTDGFSEHMYYLMSGVALTMPTNLVLEFRMRYVSGSASVNSRAAGSIGFVTQPRVGNGLNIGLDTVFLQAAAQIKGPAASVDTDDAFHTYRIEVAGTAPGSAISVFYDGNLILNGVTYLEDIAGHFGNEPLILWGEGSSYAQGVLEFLSFSHNAATTAGPAGSARLYVVGGTTNQVYRYLVASNAAPVLDFTLTDTNLSIPCGLAFSPQGEMFVGNRGSHPIFFSLTPGFVRRYAQPTGMPAFNGDLGVGSLTTPHWLAFRGEELLVADSGNNRVRRYIFSGYGEATELPSITAGLTGTGLRTVIASPDGREVFAADCCVGNNVQRYRIETNGSITSLGVLPGPYSNPHGMAFSPWGELFVANPDQLHETDSMFIGRYTFAADGTPQFNGSITHSNLFHPASVAFSPWGELFVVNVLATNVARFTFTADGTAVARGTFRLPADGCQLAFEPATDCVAVASPRLSIVKSGGNVQLRFPTEAAAYVLEWTDDLTAPVAWRPSYAPRASVNSELRVVLSATNAARFLRLRCPAE